MYSQSARGVWAILYFLGVLVLSACTAKNDVDPGATFPPGPPPPSQSPTIAISQIAAQPDTVLPGQSAVITVTASDGTGGTLNYGWHAADGTVNDSNINLVTWTAPVTEGEYRVSVDVTNSSSTVRAYLTVRVAAGAAAQPLITTVLPGEAIAGDEVRILGSGFGSTQGASTLRIGNAAATNITSWSTMEIVARVPAAAVTGAVQVIVNGVNSTSGRLIVPWANVSPDNTVASAASSGQSGPQAVSDGAGGVIVVWEDRRGGGADLYIQRLDSLGVPLWTANGVAVCDATGDQVSPSIVPDGAGGAVIAWQDRRNGLDYDIYVQRIDANGLAQWTANGIQLSGASDNQSAPRLATDGANGAIVVWEDRRNGVEYDIYAQRVDAGGAVQWTANGEPVASLAEHQLTPQIVADDAGGAIIAWADYRSAGHYDLYAQRIDASGVAQWATNGVAVADAAGNQFGPSMVADGSGGAVIVWQDYRSSADFDVYAQRLNAAGVAQWAANGVVVSNAAGNQVSPSVVASGGDAFFVAWEDYRNGNADIYAQRVQAAGTVGWTANGLAVCSAAGAQFLPRLVADDAGGAIAVWKDHRGDAGADLYVQRVNRLSVGMWGADGAVLTNADGDQSAPVIVADGAGGAVSVWEDYRNGEADLYAQGISAGGRQ